MTAAETESARDRVLRAAGGLFYERGFQAVRRRMTVIGVFSSLDFVHTSTPDVDACIDYDVRALGAELL
jgi:hypothetical protein